MGHALASVVTMYIDVSLHQSRDICQGLDAHHACSQPLFACTVRLHTVSGTLDRVYTRAKTTFLQNLKTTIKGMHRFCTVSLLYFLNS